MKRLRRRAVMTSGTVSAMWVVGKGELMSASMAAVTVFRRKQGLSDEGSCCPRRAFLRHRVIRVTRAA
ncbi:hypothetical protein GCM10020254_57400 [Streptomyces goshikiensis]